MQSVLTRTLIIEHAWIIRQGSSNEGHNMNET